MGTSIALVGPGAIGATVAALLHTAGRAVTVCGHTPRDRMEVRPDSGSAPPTGMGYPRNGVVVRKAAGHGLPTPITDVLVSLLAAASDGTG
ncbi:hypothetical protein B1R94_16555 [Mycolicibacterium litorale]|nr:hypothetical protein B1R94_16555 [Mycolicibacterium litorale]